MKSTKAMLVFSAMFMIGGARAQASGVLDGFWSEDGSKVVRVSEFNGQLTMNTRAFYSNGAPADYFFEFQLPLGRDVQVGEILNGQMRSLDGFYGCAFDQRAQAQLDEQGRLRLHYPLLTFFRRTTRVGEEAGTYYRRDISWDGWGWVETVVHFPIQNWRVISSECVVTQTNWVTSVLSPVPAP